MNSDKKTRKNILLKAMGVAVLVLLIFASIAVAEPFAYITNKDSNSVSVIDIATNKVAATINGFNGPYGVAVTPDGKKVYIANAAEKSVSVIDTASNTLIDQIGLSGSPRGVAVSPDGTTVYVTNGDKINIIDTATDIVSDWFNFGNGVLNTNGIVVSPDGKYLYTTVITMYGFDRFYKIATSNATIIWSKGIDVNPQGVAVTPDGKKVYAADDTNYNGDLVYSFNSENGSSVSVPVVDPFGIAASPDGNYIYVTSYSGNAVYRIDTKTDKINGTVYHVVSNPYGISTTPDGTRLYVACYEDNNVTVIDANKLKILTKIKVGKGPVAFGQFIGTVTGQKPIADFTSNVTSGYVPLPVLFNDTSSGNPTSWLWDFGDKVTSIAQNSTHTYSVAGKFNVSLTVKNGAGNNNKIKYNYIVVSAPKPPVANFASNVTQGNAPLSVQFNDTSTGFPTKWYWDFGDKVSSTQQNPVHTYNITGRYTVKLTVSNTNGANSKSAIITVNGTCNTSKIYGYSFNDLNKNKIMDKGETGLSFLTINLNGYDTCKGVLVSIKTTTNSTGYYAFDGIEPGMYLVSPSFVVGWLPTTDVGYTTVPSNSNKIRKDFGNTKFGK